MSDKHDIITIAVKKNFNKILTSKVPNSYLDENTKEYALDLYQNLVAALTYIKKKPFRNKAIVIIPSRLYFYEDYFTIVFTKLKNHFSKRFIKAKLEFCELDPSFLRKIY